MLEKIFTSQTNFNFSATFILSSANVFTLDENKNLLFGKQLTLYHTILYKNSFENIEGKGENAGNQHFLLFLQFFFFF